MQFFRPTGNIRAISFDLDDTLYDNHPFIVSAEASLRAQLADKYPLAAALPAAQWQAIRKQVLAEDPRLRSDMGLLRRKVLTGALASAGYTGQALQDGVEDCFTHFYFARSDFKVDKTICSLLSELAQAVPLVAITNGNVNVEQIGVAEYFSQVLHASVEQPMKPHRRMFDRCREYLGLPAANILHVGDNLHKDVYGAINAGFRAAWYAHNRPMNLNSEPVRVLPDVMLTDLQQLRRFI